MGRFERVGAGLRRMYQAGRDSLRAARARVEAEAEADQEPAGLDVAPRPPAPGLPVEPPLPALEQPPGAPAEPPAEPPAEEAVPPGLRIAAAWSWRLILIGAAVYGLLWLAGQYMLLVVPFMIALLLAGLLMPAQRALLKVGFNRSLAALLVVVSGLAVLGGTLAVVINSFVNGLPEMVVQVEKGVLELQEWIQGPPFNVSEKALDDAFQQVEEWVTQNVNQLAQGVLAYLAGTVLAGTIQFLTGLVLALVITFFFLRDGRRIWDFLVGILPRRARQPMWYAGDGAWRTLSGYIRATVLVALVDAVGIGLGLQIVSWVMKSFPAGLVLPIAALVFLGGFVPIVGAFVSGTVAVIVALATGDTLSEGLLQALIVLGIVLVVQQLESNVLQPLIVSKMVRIHPLAVILAVLGGILLAGIFGALIAVPVVAVINTVARRLRAYHERHHGRHLEQPQQIPAAISDIPEKT